MIYIIHQYLYIFNSKIDENKGVRNKMIIIGIDPGYATVSYTHLLEVGSNGNTLAQAKEGGKDVARAIAAVLNAK